MKVAIQIIICVAALLPIIKDLFFAKPGDELTRSQRLISWIVFILTVVLSVGNFLIDKEDQKENRIAQNNLKAQNDSYLMEIKDLKQQVHASGRDVDTTKIALKDFSTTSRNADSIIISSLERPLPTPRPKIVMDDTEPSPEIETSGEHKFVSFHLKAIEGTLTITRYRYIFITAAYDEFGQMLPTLTEGKIIPGSYSKSLGTLGENQKMAPMVFLDKVAITPIPSFVIIQFFLTNKFNVAQKPQVLMFEVRNLDIGYKLRPARDTAVSILKVILSKAFVK